MIYGNVQGFEIDGGFKGTEATIDLMRKLTRDGVMDERVRRLATSIVQAIPRRDYVSEAQALLTYVYDHVRYVRDPWLPDGAERVQHPVVTLFEVRSGDCDDITVALNALAGSIGVPYAYRTVSVDPVRPNEFTHVYSMLYISDRWVPADGMFNYGLGWEPKQDDPRVRFTAVREGRVAWRKDWAAR